MLFLCLAQFLSMRVISIFPSQLYFWPSVEYLIGGGQPISWSMRVNIAVDVARGISFLHSLPIQVIYRDLKASNVLLDSVWLYFDEPTNVGYYISDSLILNEPYLPNFLQDFNAKLSDFGLARSGPTGDNTHVSTRVVGTRGYAAPEYIATG